VAFRPRSYNLFIIIEKKDEQKLRVRIKRSKYNNSNGDGLVNFGFVIPAVNKPLEVNGYKEGFQFRTLVEEEARNTYGHGSHILLC